MMNLPPAIANNRTEGAKAAMLSAFVLPGVGQIYNGQWGRGLFIGLVFLVASVAFLIPLTVGVISYYLEIGKGDAEAAQQALLSIWELRYQLVLLVVVSVVLYIYSVIDAYRTGKKWETTAKSNDDTRTA